MMFDKKDKDQDQAKESGKKPMDMSLSLMDRLKQFGLSKLICVLAAGVLVLLFLSEFMNGTGVKTPTTAKTESTTKQNLKNSSSTDEYILENKNRLEQVLSKVEGIGKVEVMITVKSSKESVTLKDESSQEETTKEQDNAGGSRESSNKNSKGETVFSKSDSGVSSPYEVKELVPQIEGVVVVAQGGDNESIKSNIIEMVQALYSVPPHKIKVEKFHE